MKASKLIFFLSNKNLPWHLFMFFCCNKQGVKLRDFCHGAIYFVMFYDSSLHLCAHLSFWLKGKLKTLSLLSKHLEAYQPLFIENCLQLFGIFMLCCIAAAAAAAKSLQSCPTLCDPIDGSPPGSAVPGILQARTLEWVAISFSNAWKWKVKVKSLSRVQL